MSLVRAETADGVCTVTMCDEVRRNALSRELLAGLVEAFEAAEADDDVRVIVLTNAGNTFCAGADLSERSGSNDDIPTISPMDLFARFAKSPKPYVGRIAGHCVAGGMVSPPPWTSPSPTKRRSSDSPRSGSGWPRR